MHLFRNLQKNLRKRTKEELAIGIGLTLCFMPAVVAMATAGEVNQEPVIEIKNEAFKSTTGSAVNSVLNTEWWDDTLLKNNEILPIATTSSSIVVSVSQSAIIPEVVTSGVVTSETITLTPEEEKKIEAEKKKAKKEKEKKELKKLREFYDNVNCQTTDMSKNLGISKKRFVEIMKALPYDYANVFEDNAEFLWETAKKYDFNEFLMVGIMAQESYWGADPIATNNYSSQRISGSKYYKYATAEEGIEVLAKNLANNYLPKDGKYYSGKSLSGIGKIYCEGNTWAGAVCTCMEMVLREYFETI